MGGYQRRKEEVMTNELDELKAENRLLRRDLMQYEIAEKRNAFNRICCVCDKPATILILGTPGIIPTSDQPFCSNCFADNFKGRTDGKRT